MDMPKISVITAIYNTEQYLPKCIESLISQTYSNLEIILIENGCTDGSAEVCAAYASKDDRIKVIHLSPNNGISPAWNAGLDAATGDWIAFLDSDDWIEPDTYEYLLNKVLKYGVDIGICGFYYQYSDHKVFSGWEAERVWNTEQAMEQLLRDERFNSTWHKLWRRTLFAGLRFPDEIFGDAALAYYLFGRAKRVICLPRAKYHYLQRQDSVMRMRSIERPMSLYRIYRKRLDEMQEQWPQFQDLQVDKCIYYSLLIWHEYYKYTKEEKAKYREQLREMATFSKEHYQTIPYYADCGRKRKLALWMLRYARWWSFDLFAIADKLKEFREAKSTQAVSPPYDNEESLDTEEKIPVLNTPEPAFSENNVPVVLACSNEFVPHAAEVVQSLIDHSSANFNYDLIFLHTTITENSQRVMRGMTSDYSNVSIRFFNVREFIRGRNMQVNSQYSIETFYRLLIPQFLEKYEKVIYLDSDLTILRDVADLFFIDIGSNLLAATLDLGLISQYETDPKIRKHIKDVLQLKKPQLCFQAGVLIFNIREFNKLFMPYELLDFAESHPYSYVDQDVLNVKCYNKVYFLDGKWNVMVDNWGITTRLKAGPKDIYKKYLDSAADPYIMHHTGADGVKPWNCPTVPFGEIYWQYARKTPFYEIVLYRCLNPFGYQVFDNRSGARKLADKLLPKGSRRREFAKKILPKGSLRWRFCKKIYSFFRR